MPRAILIVLDSVGIGHARDAAAFGDEGSDTIGHIAKTLPDWRLPFLEKCGLNEARAIASGADYDKKAPREMAYGCMNEVSSGKDTTTGHWEMAGAPLDEPFATFESFPPELVVELEVACGVTFIGNIAESGTVILEKLGEEHVRTGNPILYTSADSVLQIAAHQSVIPLERLYEICMECRTIADRERIGRVIARPFLGETAANFQRTTNRKDFSLIPPRMILDALNETGIPVIGIGKISDIFAGKGISISHPTKSNAAGMAAIEKTYANAAHEALIFANLVDFDALYGHRRYPEGYANCLSEFDSWLADFLPKLGPEDLLMITADHGNDPTWRGTDHTREKVPLLVKGGGASGNSIGERETFADVAASLADFFEMEHWKAGRSFLG
ncbi:UNVERIFIED_CONTAM: hypothetical protein GTU68_016508 [Idotea baltica]|nr:hypothetical protein [Idotea baltica]